MENSLKNSTESTILPVLTFQSTAEHQSKKENSKVACLKCEQLFQFPKDRDEFLAHLYLQHRMIIEDVQEIDLMDEYILLWKQELLQMKLELESLCHTMLLPHLPDGTPSQNEVYYILSVEQDKVVRTFLKRKSLEKVLAQHQFELTDHNFSRECLYCRDVITGLRSLYLEHLFNKHFLQLGRPENLVYIDELIAKVQENLENLICLYCEKVFKDRATLKEHMRKKAHKRINPNNRTYDRYFLQNYKSPDNKQYTRRQQRQQKKPKTRQPIPIEAPQHRNRLSSQLTNESVDFDQRFANRTDDSDSDWSDWNGDEQTLQLLNCLYCSEQLPDLIQFKEHLLKQHTLDFDEEVKGLNFYQKVKIVNYIRRQICLMHCVMCNQRFETKELLLQHMQVEKHFGIGTQKQWDKPEYFFPTYEDDALLCILDDNPNDDMDDTAVKIISEDTVTQINKDAEKLSLENFNYL